MKIPVGGDIERAKISENDRVLYEKFARKVLRDKGMMASKANIRNFVGSMNPPIYRIGDLFFATERSRYFRGQVTHYRSNGRKCPAKDRYGTPYGPKSMGSNDANWKQLYPRTTMSSVVETKTRGDRYNPKPCPMTADEALQAFRLRLEANGKPANDNHANAYDGCRMMWSRPTNYSLGMPSAASIPSRTIPSRSMTL
jgi:hypothetical protein